ncbi:HVO_0476 family zinc finger protein [Deltaproteobacteria bacterium]|nr:HVO_0476 family zinc finger protein [Deltaproteobacteria bacterium]
MNDEEVEEGIMENATKCPGCGGMTGHEVLRERQRGTGVDFLLKCEECDKVHTIEFRTPPPKIIPFMLTDGPESFVVKLELDLDEIITEGDVFEHDEMQWMVTRIEDLEDKPRRKRGVDRINRIIAIRSDLVRVKITMTIGEDSEASLMLVPGDKEFVAGGIIKHEGEKWRIRALHSGTGRTLSGKMMAREIKRMYLHEPPSEVEFEPRTEQERRRAWQEGRLGHNPNPVKPPNERGGEKKRR